VFTYSTGKKISVLFQVMTHTADSRSERGGGISQVAKRV